MGLGWVRNVWMCVLLRFAVSVLVLTLTMTIVTLNYHPTPACFSFFKPLISLFWLYEMQITVISSLKGLKVRVKLELTDSW